MSPSHFARRGEYKENLLPPAGSGFVEERTMTDMANIMPPKSTQQTVVFPDDSLLPSRTARHFRTRRTANAQVRLLGRGHSLEKVVPVVAARILPLAA